MSEVYGTQTYDNDVYGYYDDITAAALASRVRQTGLRVWITDENLNDWQDFAGVDINLEDIYAPATAQPPWSWQQGHWSYRGKAAVCKRTTDEAIVRVRIGDGTANDRQLYRQIITDPTNVSQWTTWALLYSGNHYAIAIQRDSTAAAGYRIYHAKSAGVYIDNTLASSLTDVVDLSCVEGVRGAVFATKVYQAASDQADDRGRVMDLYYSPDLVAANPLVADPTNFQWFRNSIAAVRGTTDVIRRVHQYPHGLNPRDRGFGDAMMLEFMAPDTSTVLAGSPKLLRGIGGGAGYNTLEHPYMTKLEDGYFYLFYGERHRDRDGSVIGNLRLPLVWQRSANGLYFSAPMHVGYTIWGLAGVVTSGAYVYLCGNGRVLRRPDASAATEISNYVTEVTLDLPRDSDVGSGTVKVANPNNTVGALLDFDEFDTAALVGKQITVRPGFKVPALGTYKYWEPSKWWLSSISSSLRGKVNRLELEVGDFWWRLENQFRDTYHFIGRTIWDDWDHMGRNPSNQMYNYYAAGGGTLSRQEIDPERQNNYWRLFCTSGAVLWTGWKGYNCNFHVDVITYASGFTQYVYFRWKDPENWYRVVYTGTQGRFERCVFGTIVQIGASISLPSDLQNQKTMNYKLEINWNTLKVIFRGNLLTTSNVTAIRIDDNPQSWSGFVGFQALGPPSWGVSGFHFFDYEEPWNLGELIEWMLNYAGIWNINIAGGRQSDQLDITVGPQTDLTTPAEAVRRWLEVGKLALTERDGVIYLSRFKSTDPLYIIEDEITESDQIEEGGNRANLVSVDGNENSWIEVDREDTRKRDLQVISYLDIPELLTEEDVRLRALEELDKAKAAQSPGGTCVWMPHFQRKDVVRWINHKGQDFLVRIEGIQYEFNQSSTPFQRCTLDNSPVEYCEPSP